MKVWCDFCGVGREVLNALQKGFMVETLNVKKKKNNLKLGLKFKNYFKII